VTRARGAVPPGGTTPTSAPGSPGAERAGRAGTQEGTSAPAAPAMRVPVERLRAFTEAVFQRADMSRADAAALTDVLVWSDLRGISALGVAKIPQYLGRLRAGVTSPTSARTKVLERDATAVLDAADTWGQIAGARAMRHAIGQARSAGVGVAAVRNTTSAGPLGYFALLAADQKMVGLAINNSPPLQAPWGGTTKVIGNQAFAIACPARRHDPLLLDMATTAITLARIHEYRDRGEPLPPDVALDADGQPTIDPDVALSGILRSMGGHRGSGLAVMWEVLTGVLAGGERYGPAVSGPDELDRPQAVSMFLMAIDPEFAQPLGEFLARVDRLIDEIHASPPAPGVERVTVPGERGFALARERARDGIPIRAALHERLTAIGADLGLTL